MKPARTSTTTLLLLTTTAWGVLGLGLAPEARARGGQARVQSHGASAGGHRAQATSHRPAHRRPSAGRPAARHPARSRVVPPGGLGSAANARPGFYQQLSAPYSSHGAVVPVPIYVYPTPSYYPPLETVSPREIPAPAPQPIYIVTPPAATAAPAPAPVQTAPTPAPPAPPQVAEPAPPPQPRSTEPGEVQFSVLPADAEIYLDDDYLGTGAELAALASNPSFAPGVHVLEVTHPEFRSQRVVFGVTSNDETHVLVDLAIDRVGRRSRIK